MRLPRRTFLAFLAGFAATVVSVAHALAWPSWWRKTADERDAAASRTATADNTDSSGVKITTVERRNLRGSTQDMNRDPSVFYALGEWRRMERPRSFGGGTRPDGSPERKYGPHMATIVRPDLGKMFELNLDGFAYTQSPYPPKKPRPFTKAEMEARGVRVPPPPGSAKPTFKIETTTRDTGERKDMFGYVARHVITTRKEIPLEGSTRGPQETVTDAWYIDLEPQFYPGLSPRNLPLDASGKPRRVHAYVTVSSAASPAPPELPEFVDIGEPETGFAVEEKRSRQSIYQLPDGTTRQSEEKSETSVTIEKGQYDRKLFEVPRGFKRVSRIQPNPT